MEYLKTTTFKNKEFGSVRMVDDNGRLLFCGADVASALGYKNASKALDYGEDDGEDDLTEDDLTEDDIPDDDGEDFEGEAFLDLLADMAGKARFVSEVLDTLLEISGGQPDSAASENE